MKQCSECGGTFGDELSFCPKDGTALHIDRSQVSDPLIGRVIAGKYKIIEFLGGGGMGLVYKAEHALLNQFVAVKILRGHLASDEDYLKRFQREARLACKISHPNAIALHDFGVDDDSPYLVMEFIQGSTLKEYLKVHGALPLDKALPIIEQIGGAIAEAHALGIVHRDLKPENIMITVLKNGREWSKVLDFGIAKNLVVAGSSDPNLTKTGTIFGSPRYMSPEQALEKEIDTRSDLYSFGIIVYEMLANRVPFEANSAMETIVQHVSKSATPIQQVISQKIPEPISTAIMRLLEKDRDARFSKMEEFLEVCRQVATPQQSKYRSPFFVLVAVALGLVLGVGVVKLISNGSNTGADEAAIQLKLKELERIHREKESEIEKATVEAERKKREAEDALLEIQMLNAAKEESKQKTDELRLEAERLEKELASHQDLAQQAAAEAERLRVEREAEAKRAEALKIEALEAERIANARKEEAALAAKETEEQRLIREQEEAKAEKLREEAQAANERAEALKFEATNAESRKIAAERAASSAELKRAEAEQQRVKIEASSAEKAKLEAKSITPLRPKTAANLESRESALRRAERLKQQAIEETRKLEDLRAARIAEQQRLEAAQRELEQRRSDTEGEDLMPTTEVAAPKLPRQGKKR